MCEENQKVYFVVVFCFLFFNLDIYITIKRRNWIKQNEEEEDDDDDDDDDVLYQYRLVTIVCGRLMEIFVEKIHFW